MASRCYPRYIRLLFSRFRTTSIWKPEIPVCNPYFANCGDPILSQNWHGLRSTRRVLSLDLRCSGTVHINQRTPMLALHNHPKGAMVSIALVSYYSKLTRKLVPRGRAIRPRVNLRFDINYSVDSVDLVILIRDRTMLGSSRTFTVGPALLGRPRHFPVRNQTEIIRE